MVPKTRWLWSVLIVAACDPHANGFDAGQPDASGADHATISDTATRGDDVVSTGTDVPTATSDVPATGTDVPIATHDAGGGADVATAGDAGASGAIVACGGAGACSFGSNAGCASGQVCTPIYNDPAGLGYAYNPAGLQCTTPGAGAFGADCMHASDCGAGMTCQYNVCSYYCAPSGTLPPACMSVGYQFCTREDGSGSCWGVCDRNLGG